MEQYPSGTNPRTILLEAAYKGVEQLKKFALELDGILGDGLPTILGNTKDKDGRRALHYAAAGGRQDVLEYLIQEIKLDVNVQDNAGETPMALAAMEGRVSTVGYLLRMGANPEQPNDTNMHPLHHAAMKGHNGVIIVLHSNGVNIDVTNDFGSPLQYACAFGQHETVKLLLCLNDNPNLIFNEMSTSLQASILSKSWQCAEHLLKAGADPNAGPDGFKPLSFAAEMGLVQIIKLLVEAGADPNVTNIQGLKPIEDAALHGLRVGVEILFPVTSPIPSYVDWSIDGVMKHANSTEFKIKMLLREKESFLEAKSRGTSAFQRKEYWVARFWYTKALRIDPTDAAVLSNRSLCHVRLNSGESALQDATQCVLARPNWPKAYYRKGVALKLLNRLDDAADAFSDGLKLDPENKELEAAFREVSLARMNSATADKPVE